MSIDNFITKLEEKKKQLEIELEKEQYYVDRKENVYKNKIINKSVYIEGHKEYKITEFWKDKILETTIKIVTENDIEITNKEGKILTLEEIKTLTTEEQIELQEEIIEGLKEKI